MASASKVTVSGLAVGAIAGSQGSQASDYALTSSSAEVAAAITARTVTLGAGKTYDGNTSLTGAVSIGTGVAGETLAYSGALASNANVATAGKSISAITLADATGLASDYRLPLLDAAHAALTITAKTVALAASKTYDGSSSLTAAVNITTGVAGELLAYSGAVASDANVAVAGKTISAITLLDSATARASNYALPALAAAPVTITPFIVNLTAARAYNGSTVVDASVFNFGMLPHSETLGLTGSASIVDQHVGSAKAVNRGSLALADGTGLASNYTLAGGVASATIEQALLTVSASVASRRYDGSTSATLTALALGGVVDGETLRVVAAGGVAFDDKNAGAAKRATISGITLLDGAAGAGRASDYTVVGSAATNAAIGRADLTVAGVVALDKVYDGSTAATINVSGAVLSGALLGDDLHVGAISGVFADKNAGLAKAVTGSAFVLTGADSINYSLVQPAGLSASIVPRSLAVTAAALDKVYDGSVAAAVNLLDNRIAGDRLSVAASAAFLDKNAGINKFVSVSGISLSGVDAANYSANSSTASFASVARANLAVTAAAQSKLYDGSSAASVALLDNRVLGDVLGLSYGSAAFADKNAGVGKTVTVNGISLSGADAGNYNVGSSALGLADIGKKVLTVNTVGQSKVYDGGTSASVTLGDDRIGGDALSLSYVSVAFTDKNVGAAKAVTVSGIVASGADAGNYSVASNASTSAAITPKSLTVRATGGSKVYDGNTTAPVTLADNRLAGDSLVLAANASFSDASAGSGKAIGVSAIRVSGSDSGNYALSSSVASAVGAITPLADVWILPSPMPAPAALPGSTTVSTVSTAALPALPLPLAPAAPLPAMPDAAGETPLSLPAGLDDADDRQREGVAMAAAPMARP